MAGEGADTRKRAHERTAANTGASAYGKEGAHIRRRKRSKVFQRRRTTAMLGDKGEKLHDVAPIGFKRPWRHPSLGAEMVQPALDLVGDFDAADSRKLMTTSRRF
jgi:hypothetical protein